MNSVLFFLTFFSRASISLVTARVKLKWFCCFCCGLSVILSLALSEALCGVALGCLSGSRGATLGPSSPVISPDGCKAALLQNMSRGWWRGGGCGNGGKGQRPKTLSHTSSRFHGLWHPAHAAWNIKTGCQAATNEKSKSLKCILCIFFKWGGVFSLGDKLLKHKMWFNLT